MKKQIELNSRKVPYTLRISKVAKRLRLAIYCDGSFVVTVPQKINQNVIERFIIEKSRWVIEKLDYFNSFSKSFKPVNSREEFLRYRDDARKLVEEKVLKFNEIYKFKYNKIRIKNQKTRWGSCSGKSNLNFNYKIALLPERVAEYIVVHELCHLGEFNHSKKFWDLVSKTIPDYRQLRNDLRRRGLSNII